MRQKTNFNSEHLIREVPSYTLTSTSPPRTEREVAVYKVPLVSLLAVLQEIRRGTDVTRADNKGRTALHFAATRGDTNMGRTECYTPTQSYMSYM